MMMQIHAARRPEGSATPEGPPFLKEAGSIELYIYLHCLISTKMPLSLIQGLQPFQPHNSHTQVRAFMRCYAAPRANFRESANASHKMYYLGECLFTIAE